MQLRVSTISEKAGDEAEEVNNDDQHRELYGSGPRNRSSEPHRVGCLWVCRSYSVQSIHPDDFPRCKDISCYPHLAGIDLPDVDLDEVTILLGQTDADCLIPLDVVQGQRGEPYATRTKLGWTINGPMKMNAERKPKVKNFHAKV